LPTKRLKEAEESQTPDCIFSSQLVGGNFSSTMMLRFLRRLKTKPTLFFIVGIAVIIYSIPMFFYSTTLQGGESLIALLYIFLIIFSIIGLIIDHIAIKFLDYRIVSLLEVVLLLIIYIFSLYYSKSAVIELAKTNHPYLIVIDSSKGIRVNQFNRKGLFDKQLEIVNQDLIFLNKSSLSKYSLRFQGDNNWQGRTIFSGYKPEYNFNWTFVLKNDSIIYSRGAIDSLIQLRLNQQIRNAGFKGY
jgi:hypothetical protein